MEDAARGRTLWLWLLALLPLLQVVGMEPALLAFLAVEGPRVSDSVARALVVAFTVDLAVTAVVIGGGGLLGHLDQRQLQRRGVLGTFPWGWSFFYPAYVIGRTVIVRRRIGGGVGPLVVMIVGFAGGMALLLTQFLLVVLQILESSSALG